MSIRNLEVDMPGEAVKGLDLDIRKGEIIGLGGLPGGKIGVSNGILDSTRQMAALVTKGSSSQ